MKNFLIEIRYRGSGYHGWQVQENARSVMEAVQDALERVMGRRADVSGCSRTDTGVHANQYFFHMYTESPLPGLPGPEGEAGGRFLFALNNALEEDIAACSCVEVPLAFHARYSCVEKEYIYQIYDGFLPDPFWREYALFHRRPVAEKKLEQAAQVLVGTHDFTTFRALGGKLRSPVKTVKEISFTREGHCVRMRIRADGYLYNMVRIIVGTLLDMGDGLLPQDGLGDILEAKNRLRAGHTAPPQGLFLNRVIYPGVAGSETPGGKPGG